MALVVNGSIQANGKLNDVVFYRSRWGNVVRANNLINQANSPQQTAVRGSFTTLSNQWTALSPADKTAWATFARFLDPKNYFEHVYYSRGYQEFLSRNINLNKIGKPPIGLPAGYGNIQSITKLTPQPGDAWAFHFGWEHADGTITLAPNQYMVISSTINRAPHSRDPDPPYRITQIFPPGTTGVQDLSAAWATTWAPTTVIPGMRIFISAQMIDGLTGRAGTKVYASGLMA